MTNSVDPAQTAPIGAVCPGSSLIASILKCLAIICGGRLQQTTFSDEFFSWRFKDLNVDEKIMWATT